MVGGRNALVSKENRKSNICRNKEKVISVDDVKLTKVIQLLECEQSAIFC